MIFKGFPGGTRVETTHPGEGDLVVWTPKLTVTNTRLLTCKQLKADTRLVNLQLQTAGLEMTGKLDCQLVIERLEGLGTVSLHTILRSLMAPDKQGPADIYIYIYIYIQVAACRAATVPTAYNIYPL